MKTNDELIEEFAKLHSTNPPTQIITSSRKKVEDWLRTVLTQKDAEVARERERIVGIIKNELEIHEQVHEKSKGILAIGRARVLGMMYEKYTRIGKIEALRNIISLITNKGDTNN